MPFDAGKLARRVAVALFFMLMALAFFLMATGAAQAAQPAGGRLAGRLSNALSADPVAGATVTLEELARVVTSTADGSYVFENVPPGKYHLAIRADGYRPSRIEVTVAGTSLVQNVAVDPELHYSEVVSVSPEPRNQFESYQPTSVLAGQDLSKQLEGTLGATLASQPGVAQRSFGPGPSRPVIRGLDGDRVLILEDGQRMGDLSSQSGDHGVNVNPAAASRVEVVRGPATLLYGANAIGGLVNVITHDIPSAPVPAVQGGFTIDGGTAANEGGAAGDVLWGAGNVAVHASGSGRRSSNYAAPDGTVPNSATRSAFANVGTSWLWKRGYIGGNYGYDDTKYGIPFVEEGKTHITPRRQLANLRMEAHDLTGPITTLRASYGYRRYRHNELDGEEIASTFKNDVSEFEVLAGHRAFGRLKGTIGASALLRSFSASGEETLSPPVDQRGGSAYVYEEVTWPHVTFQFGGRYDHSGYSPEGGLEARDFNTFSGSLGVLFRPTETSTIAFSLARASRFPALEELYFFGPHGGNFAFEIGNPTLSPEHGLGFDLSYRWRFARASGELTYFRNAINDYVFRNPTGEVDDESGFPVIRFTAADSVLQGVEAHADAALTSWLFAEFGVDYVRGELSATNQPLPRIPPLRFRGGLRYQRNALQAGGEWTSTATQDRVFGAELPTDGYDLLRLFASYSIPAGRVVNTITARLDNATDELYRNHLSFIKDLAPEMGRNFKVIYGVKF